MCGVLVTGEETCRLYYESACTTKYVEKTPGKFVGDTSCEKLPVNLCGDMSCKMVPGEEECHNKVSYRGHRSSYHRSVVDHSFCSRPA